MDLAEGSVAYQNSYQYVKSPETGKVLGKLAYLKGQLISEEFFLSSDRHSKKKFFLQKWLKQKIESLDDTN